MNNYYPILRILILLVINCYFGHYFSPAGILLTPIIIVVCSWTIAFKTTGIPLPVRSLLIVSCVSINNILIKLYSGGDHDYEGLGWIHALTSIGLIPVIVILIKMIDTDKSNGLQKLIAFLIFPPLVIIHYYFFYDLGVGRSYPL